MTDITELRGLDLLDAAIAHIEAHPETWLQGSYRCESGMCLAGWAAQLAGGQWVTSADSDPEFRANMTAERDDPAQDVDFDPDYGQIIHVADRAERLLGGRFLDEVEDGEDEPDLFAADNTLDDLKRMRDRLRSGAVSFA